MSSKTFRATIFREGSMCFIPLGFDPKVEFGRVRAPVRVTLNGYSYRSTIAAMGGPPCIPLRKSNREAAGLEGGETIEVRVDLDTDKREVKPPADFVKALKAAPSAWERWRAPQLQPSARTCGGDRASEEARDTLAPDRWCGANAPGHPAEKALGGGRSVVPLLGCQAVLARVLMTQLERRG
jgi:hypothetical protein